MEPRRPAQADYTKPVAGTEFLVQRHLVGYAYPANGNTHNPTPDYEWLLLLDGKVVDSSTRRGPLVAASREANASEAYRA